MKKNGGNMQRRKNRRGEDVRRKEMGQRYMEERKVGDLEGGKNGGDIEGENKQGET